MRYLVTGGCGFVGSNVAARALRDGHSVAILDNLSRTGGERNLIWLREQGDCAFSRADVRIPEDCRSIVEQVRPDVVFHLAGQVAMTTSLQDPRLDFEINALGTLNMLEAVRAHCPRAAFLYSSTNKVYGDLDHLRYGQTASRYVLLDYPNGVPESIGLDFRSPYGCSKGSADQYVLDYARIYGLRTAVFRHSSIYGERQFSTVDQGWVGWFCEQAILQSVGHAGDFTVSGDGKQVRDVLHVDDAVALYLAAAVEIDRIAGQPFNIGGGMENSLSILELLSLLESSVGVQLRWRSIAQRQSDQRVFVADSGRLRSILDWQPRVRKADGVARMLRWIGDLRGVPTREAFP
jgi:CDP-paratose 2-epimerase